MAEPRPSTDEETAPLLAGGDGERRLFNPSNFTAREKLLAVVGLILLIISGTFIGLFAGAEHSLKKERQHHHYPEATTTVTKTVNGPIPTGKPAKSLCLTPGCIQAASDILKSMNTSVDPCEDFYYFANGGWEASHVIPTGRASYGTFNKVSDDNNKILVKVLESIQGESDEPDALDGEESAHKANLIKLRNAYTSCMNTDHLDKVGLKPLLAEVQNVTGPFGGYDLNPMPEDGDSLVDNDWRGAYSDDYVIPESLRVASTRGGMLEAKRQGAMMQGELPAVESSLDLKPPKFDPKRRQKITRALAYLHARQVDTLFLFDMEGDSGGNNSQISTLYLHQSFGGLPSKEYYEEKPILDLYQSVLAGILTEVTIATKAEQKRGLLEIDLLTDLAADVTEAVEEEGWPWPWPGGDKEPEDEKPSEPLDKRMEKLASQVVKFEQSIARAGADARKLFNPKFGYNPFPTKDVEKALPFVDLPEYIAAMAAREFPSQIIVSYPPYLKSITKLVAEVPDHVLSAYFVTRLSLTFATGLGPNTSVHQQARRLDEVLRGLKKGVVENRQDVCLRALDDTVGFILGAEFVKEAFSPTAKDDGTHIIRSIVKAFHDKLPDVSWMDKESYTAAQKKANALIPKVGYPLYPNTTDPASLQRYYANLPISSTDYFSNLVATYFNEARTAWLRLGSQRNRESWEMYPQTVNAYYSPPDGEIVFPAGILQPPFYSLEWPAQLKYGAFGSVAAHELTHAFDDTGAQYNDKGLLRDWWTNSTVEEFTERAQCLARQYSEYYITANGKKYHIDGNGTLGENIGDSGISQAFIAWQNAAETKHEAALLPGVEYSPEQLFFIAFARVWAGLRTPEAAISQIRTDPHSPGYWRTIGTLRNNEAFHKAFSCKKGSRMNPEHQCRIWE